MLSLALLLSKRNLGNSLCSQWESCERDRTQVKGRNKRGRSMPTAESHPLMTKFWSALSSPTTICLSKALYRSMGSHLIWLHIQR